MGVKAVLWIAYRNQIYAFISLFYNFITYGETGKKSPVRKGSMVESYWRYSEMLKSEQVWISDNRKSFGLKLFGFQTTSEI